MSLSGEPVQSPRVVPVAAPMSDAEQRRWATLVQVSPIVFGLVGLPILGPLIGYLVLRDRGDEVRFHAAQALNLQITLVLAAIASGILCIAFIGFVLLPAVLVAGLVLEIVATVKASRGERWRIPLAVPFVR